MSVPKKPVWITASVLIAAGIVSWAVVGFSQTSEKSQPLAGPTLRSAKVQRGTINRTTRLTGVTAPVKFASMAAPMLRGPDAGRSLVLIFLAKAGSWVKKGDIVAQIDAQALKDHADDINSQVQQAEADIKKRRAEQAIEWENLQQTLRAAKAEVDKAKLDQATAEIRTPIDAELLKLAVEEAEAAYAEQLKDLKIRQESFKAEIRILELTRDRHARHRDRHLGDVERFTMHAPIEGLVVMMSTWRGEMAQIELGDEVRPGQPFMKIVDPNDMLVEANISQAGSEILRLGQQATVRFDAFQDLELPAEIVAIGAMATGGRRQNYYVRNLPVKLRILKAEDRVIPDLSASAEVLVGTVSNALSVPRAALRWRNDQPYVRVWKGGQMEERPVQLGLRNGTRAVVTSGLSEGDTVLLEDPPQANKAPTT